jgi:uncharacterized membrane protein YhaH (DUF805 family)
LNNPTIRPGADLADPRAGESSYSPQVFSLGGRIGRLRYISYNMLMYLLVFVIAIPICLLGTLVGNMGEGGVYLVLLLMHTPLTLVGFVLMRRRLNDIGHSGWFSLLVFIPFVVFPVLLYLLCAPGTAGPNAFGPKPEKNSMMVRIGACSPLLVLAILAALLLPIYWDYFDRPHAEHPHAQAQQVKAEQVLPQ